MKGTGLPRGGWAVVFALLSGCATPVDDLGVAPTAAAGTGGVSGGSCHAPTCGACKTCKDMCLCSGSSLAQCQVLCAQGTGGGAGTGAGGASGGAGGSAAGGAGAGGSGGYGSTGGYASGGGSGSTCSVTVGDPACDACIGSQCCSETQACAYDPTCGQLMNCLATAPECQNAYTLSELASCADTACPAYASAKNLFIGYVSCLGTSCAAQCGS